MLVLFAAVVSAGCGSKEEAYRQIKVLSLQGTATVTRASVGSMDAYEDMRLETGDAVSVPAGSTLVLELDGDKYVMLEPGTKLTLEAEGTATDSKTTIHLQEGAVVNHLTQKLNENSSYEVTVPNSTMAVRGTVFRVAVIYDENGDSFATVSVFQGVVTSRLIFPDGTVEGLEKEREIPAGREVIVHGDTEISEYLWGDEEEPHEIDYSQLPKEVLEFLIDCIEREEQQDGEELSISKEECEELLRELEQTDDTEEVDAEPEEQETENESEDEEDTLQPLVPAEDQTQEESKLEPLPSTAEPETPKKSSSSSKKSESTTTEQTKTYTLTFQYNGTTFCTQSVEEGKTAVKPTLLPSLNGYWALSGKEFDFSSQKITGNQTLTWVETK